MRTVDAPTPLNALVGSVAFGIIFHLFCSASYEVIMEKKSESSTWIKKED
jgi:hypothetical protein